MRIPVDTGRVSFICAGTPEPVVEFESRRPKTDSNGVALFQVALVAMTDGEAEVTAVKVPGEPKGLDQGGPVRLHGLTALAWVMGDRDGVAYNATGIETATGPTPSPAKSGS